MPTTTGQPERSRQWGTDDWSHPVANPWSLEAVAQRGYTDWEEPEDAPEAAGSADSRSDGPRRSSRSLDAARAAVADAMGVDESELDDLGLDDLHDIITYDLAEPHSALDALDRALANPLRAEDRVVAAPGDSDRAYVVREGNWRERNGMPRKRTSVPPSRTPEARRERNIREKAKRLGISFDEAEQTTQRRQRRTGATAARRHNAAPDSGMQS
jgi:hypothetical protein